jgi:hypothetical protein
MHGKGDNIFGDKSRRGVPLRDWAAPSYDPHTGRSCSTNGGQGRGAALQKDCSAQIPRSQGEVHDKHDNRTPSSGAVHSIHGHNDTAGRFHDSGRPSHHSGHPVAHRHKGG